MLTSVLLSFILVMGHSQQTPGYQQAPFIRYQPEDQIVKMGDPIRLRCYVMGHPLPNVTWYKDGVKLDITSKPFITVYPNHTLVIQKPVHNSNRKDDGTYYCVAKNSAGIERSKNVTVIVPYLNGEFKKSPQSATKFQTKMQKFTCIPPDGYPKPAVVEWRKDGITLFQVESDEVTKKYKGGWHVSREGDKRTLSFWVTLDSAGVYSCIARSIVGVRMSSPAHLTVKVIPPDVSMKELTEAYVGAVGELYCKIKVPLPDPQRIWSKVNGIMPNRNRLKETDDGKLTISNLKESDSGTYQCLTRNEAGEMSVRGNLMVYKKPVYIIQPTSLEIPVGRTAKFECSAKYGKNIHIKYRYNNKWYSKTETHPGGVKVNSENELIIPNVQLSDSPKDIQCFIHDDFSSFDTDTSFLTVLNTTLPPPSIYLQPLTVTVMEGNHMTLTCTASGIGDLKFQWISASNGVEFTNQVMKGLSITPFMFGSNFTITNVLSTDGRAYRCKVTGDGGSQSLISMVTVQPTVGKPPEEVPFVYVRKVKSTSIDLVWGHPRTKVLSPVTSYKLSIRNIKKGRSSRTITVPKEFTSRTIDKLQPSSVYVFSVKAVNQFGAGPSKESSNTETLKIHLTTSTPVSSGFVDKLLDIVIRLTKGMVRDDRVEIYWSGIPSSRITSFGLFYKTVTGNIFNIIEINDTRRSSYVIGGLNPLTKYEIKLQAYNDGYQSRFSPSLYVMTEKQVSLPPPINVGIVKIDNENLEVYWSPPPGFHDMEGVKGYQLTCLNADKTPFFVGEVNKQAKRYLMSGLDTYELYTISVAIKAEHGIGNSSQSFSFLLGSMKNGEVIGAHSRDRTNLKTKEEKPVNSILEVIKQPWFIGTIGTLVWLFFLVIVIFLCCRRIKRQRQLKRYNESVRGLIPGNRTLDTVDTNLSRSRWNESTTSYEPTPQKRKFSCCCCCANKDDSSDEDFPNRADIKPLMTYTRHESVEQSAKGGNGDINFLKENNTAIAMKNGYMVGMPLNNELKFNSRLQDTGDEYNRLKNRMGISQDLTPSLHSDNGLRCDTRGKTDSVERRHAEIVRTAANKSFPDAELVNVMETNPQASWKREKPNDSPKVVQKPPGENTLQRQGKSQFKPVPQLEVLNWADGLPNPEPLTTEGSQTSGRSSPKLSSSASIFSDGIDVRPESRMSHTGSASSLNKYPFEKRRRKTSNASSMLSSELYQSELDPSCYSDAISERKKKKDKVVPPPIDLEGLTSDILLQWAESVTNSSPSSSGSSSPSRLSGISSEGSIYTDEDFAQAVAAVAECGGFNMDYDYSLPGMPGTQPAFQSSRNAKMNKIDEALHQQRSKFRNNPGLATPNKLHDPHSGASNAFFPQISMSSYLTGSGKGPPSSYGGHSGIPRLQYSHRKRSNPLEKNLRYGTGFQDVDSVSSVSSKPLTVSNLLEHDSSLGRDKKEATKPLTVSNLLQHDSSLDRPSILKQNERLPREVPPVHSEGQPINKTKLLMPEIPLSLISALERNESINSNSKDSANSSSKQDSEVENGGTSERVPASKKHSLTGKMHGHPMEYPQC